MSKRAIECLVFLCLAFPIFGVPKHNYGYIVCNGKPIPNCPVTLTYDGKSSGAVTDADGRFEIRLAVAQTGSNDTTLTIKADCCPNSFVFPNTTTGIDVGVLNCKCCVPPPAGMTAWWPFEVAGRSPDIVDANHAVINGTTTTDTNVGDALCFNGTNAYGVVPNNPDVDFAGDCTNDVAEAFTIDFWIKTSANKGTFAVLDKRVSAPNVLRGWSIYLWNGRVGFQMATGSSSSGYSNLTSPFSVADGKWHFMAITATRCKGAVGTFYVDGQTSNFQPRVGSISNDAPLYIATNAPNLGGASRLRGCLDELEIFERVLDTSELDAIYHAGTMGKCKPKYDPNVHNTSTAW